MGRIEYIYENYSDNYKCNYYLLESTKKFVDTGDKVTAFDIKIEKVLRNGEILETYKVVNVGINKRDVIEQIKEGQVNLELFNGN